MTLSGILQNTGEEKPVFFFLYPSGSRVK